MAAIIAQITRAKRERDKKKTYQTEKCMWVIFFPRRIDNQWGFVGPLEIFLIRSNHTSFLVFWSNHSVYMRIIRLDQVRPSTF